ncbi:YbjP/YqhG family protein [Burkholderiaceae bacterium DAT-1]|nr:YbjP/YqhG family protein [Burkholderiaceae bacterium DAT-1]
MLGVLACAPYVLASSPLPSDPVKRIYHDFAWEDAEGTGTTRKTLLDESDEVWQRYFTPELIHLMRNDRECAERSHEICWLDFAILWANQDPAMQNISIRRGRKTNIVEVKITRPNSPASTHIRYVVKQVGGRWLIDDVIYQPDMTLKALLKKAL